MKGGATNSEGHSATVNQRKRSLRKVCYNSKKRKERENTVRDPKTATKEYT